MKKKQDKGKMEEKEIASNTKKSQAKRSSSSITNDQDAAFQTVTSTAGTANTEPSAMQTAFFTLAHSFKIREDAPSYMLKRYPILELTYP